MFIVGIQSTSERAGYADKLHRACGSAETVSDQTTFLNLIYHNGCRTRSWIDFLCDQNANQFSDESPPAAFDCLRAVVVWPTAENFLGERSLLCCNASCLPRCDTQTPNSFKSAPRIELCRHLRPRRHRRALGVTIECLLSIKSFKSCVCGLLF